MAGEMSQSEVTRESFPGLFALRDALKRRGIASEPRAFDQYQGPYLRVPGVGSVWYSPDSEYTPERALFQIEAADRKYQADPTNYMGAFQYVGSQHVHQETQDTYRAGCYTLRQAARRIAEVVK